MTEPLNALTVGVGASCCVGSTGVATRMAGATSARRGAHPASTTRPRATTRARHGIAAHSRPVPYIDRMSHAVALPSDANAEAQVLFQAGLLAAVQQAIVATDLDGRITYWNRAAEGGGLLAQDVLGKPLLEIPLGAARHQAKELLDRVSGGNALSGEPGLL